MATFSVSTSPTQIDDGTSETVTVVNTAGVPVTVDAPQACLLKARSQLNPGQSVTLYPEGIPVTATAATGTGNITVTTTARGSGGGGVAVTDLPVYEDGVRVVGGTVRRPDYLIPLAKYLPVDYVQGDDTSAAFQAAYAAMTASYNQSGTVVGGLSGGIAQPRVKIGLAIPPGTHVVTQPAAMLAPLRGTNGTRMGIEFVGAGRGKTVVVFQPATVNADAFLLDNEEWMDVRFRELTFYCGTAGAGWMRSTRRAGPTPPATSPQDMTFDHVQWSGPWGAGLRLLGDNNNSEMLFNRCVVNGSYGNAAADGTVYTGEAWLHAGTESVTGGDQFLNYSLRDCKVEYEYGTALYFERGGNIDITGGSWIHTAATVTNTGLFVRLGKTEGTQHASGVMRASFRNMRVEHRSLYSHLVECYWPNGSVVFDSIDTSSHTSLVANQKTNRTAFFSTGSNSGPVVDWRASMLTGYHEYKAGSSGTNGWRWPTSFTYHSCTIMNHEEISDAGTATPGDSFIMTANTNAGATSGSRPAIYFDDHCRVIVQGGLSTANPRKMLVGQTVNGDFASHARRDIHRVTVRDTGGLITANSTYVPVYVLPVGAVVTGFRAIRTVTSGETNPATSWAYTLADADGTTVAQLSGGGSTAWNTAWTKADTIDGSGTLAGGRVVRTTNQRTLSVTSSGITSNSAGIQMWIEYLA